MLENRPFFLWTKESPSEILFSSTEYCVWYKAAFLALKAYIIVTPHLCNFAQHDSSTPPLSNTHTHTKQQKFWENSEQFVS